MGPGNEQPNINQHIVHVQADVENEQQNIVEGPVGNNEQPLINQPIVQAVVENEQQNIVVGPVGNEQPQQHINQHIVQADVEKLQVGQNFGFFKL